MFLQIHTLTSYVASLLNRDDAGLAKRIPFGNAERMRVSSQCLKRHWRERLHETQSLPGGIRSRQFFEREVLPRVMDTGIAEAQARKLTEAVLKRLIQGGQDKESPLRLNQPVLFGRPEADFLVNLIVDSASSGGDPVTTLEARFKDEKSNFRAMLRAAGHGNLMAGIEGALFGRFVTSDILARSDACVHVAHAITVHPLNNEVDFFTVVDDLNRDDEAGAAHAGDMELGSGLFYGYVVVDVPLLVSNLSGCERSEWHKQSAETLQDARKVLAGLIDAIATVSPGAKLGATAPYARAECVLLETGRAQPRTLANAYLQALKLNGDPMQGAVDALGRHLDALDGMYGVTEARFVSATGATRQLGDVPRAPLQQTVAAALDTLFGSP